jgi:threonine 3-dehydrogenase
MLAVIKPAPSPGICLDEAAPPVLQSTDDVIIKVEAVGICGTDLHIADWTGGYDSMADAMPVTLGHEFSGIVTEGPKHVLGQRVVIRPSVTCNDCQTCGKDREDICTRRTGIGIRRNGGFASHTVVPLRNCVTVPGSLDAELAALTEPMTVSAQAIRQAGDLRGKHVLVLGPGPIGLGAAIFAELAGAADVIIAGRHDRERFAWAHRMGFPRCIDLANDADAGERVRAAAPSGYDVIVEATGAPEAVTAALGWLRPGGCLVIAGIHSRSAVLDLTALVRNQHRILGSYRAPLALWPEVLNAMAASPDRFLRLITHRLPLSRALAGFDMMRQRNAVKVMLRP